MPKMKTHSGAAKRFTKTGTGKIKRNKMNRNHLLEGRSTKRKAKLRKAAFLTKGDAKRIKSMIAYVK